jgi:hypothetical protein
LKAVKVSMKFASASSHSLRGWFASMGVQRRGCYVCCMEAYIG